MKKQTASDGGATGYYNLPDGAKTLGDLIEFKDMNFNVGNIFKASYRLGDKEGVDMPYDLRKIIYSAQRELARYDKAPTVQSTTTPSDAPQKSRSTGPSYPRLPFRIDLGSQGFEKELREFLEG